MTRRATGRLRTANEMKQHRHGRGAFFGRRDLAVRRELPQQRDDRFAIRSARRDGRNHRDNGEHAKHRSNEKDQRPLFEVRERVLLTGSARNISPSRQTQVLALDDSTLKSQVQEIYSNSDPSLIFFDSGNNFYFFVDACWTSHYKKEHLQQPRWSKQVFKDRLGCFRIGYPTEG
jgi:hypothetical protein